MTKASDNIFPKVIESMNTSDPAAPTDSSWKVYAKANGIFARSSNSVVGPFVGSTSGAVGVDTIWDAAGDLAVGTGPDAAARFAIGSNGRLLRSTGTTVSWTDPPGFEYDYAEIQASVSPTATTEGTANTVVTGNAVTYDGSTKVLIEFYAETIRPRTDGTAGSIMIYLYQDGTSIGRFGLAHKSDAVAANWGVPCRIARRMTPSNGSHTYSIRAAVSGGTGLISASTGGLGAAMPAFLRITKVA